MEEREQTHLRELGQQSLSEHNYQAAHQIAAQMITYSELEARVLDLTAYLQEGNTAAAEAVAGELKKIPRPGVDVYVEYLYLYLAYQQKKRIEILKPLEELLEIAAELGERGLETKCKICNLLGMANSCLGRAREAAEYDRMAADFARSNPPKVATPAATHYSNFLFTAHNLDLSPDEKGKIAQGYGQYLGNIVPYRQRKPTQKKKLRLGYLSPDFRQHVVMRFVQAFFRNYDRENFTVYAYAMCHEDAVTQEIKPLADGWRNVHGWPTSKIADLIYQDKIDILIDLAGHTQGGTLPVLAYRPAPLQMCGIGWFASTGLKTVDYIIGDAYLDDEDTQQEFTEKLLVLPHSHFCYTPLPNMRNYKPAVAPPCQNNGYITFGSFNNLSKLSDEVIRVWGKIMEAVPGSRLLLKGELTENQANREYLWQRFVKVGVTSERIMLRGFTDDYLQEYDDMDIALDTFPYPGGGTTCDALYMGVPVITLKGRTHGGRFGYSLLNNIGLDGLCCDTVEDYVARAVALAGDTELIATLRKNLRGMMEKSPVMDAKGYMQDLEAAYRQAWKEAGMRKTPKLSPEEITETAKNLENFIAAQDFRQAMAVADVLWENDELAEKLLRRMAVAYIDGGDGKMAVNVTEKLLQVAPGGYALYLAGEAARTFGDLDSARDIAQKALAGGELSPSEMGMTHHLLAEIYKAQGDRGAAAEEYRLASQGKPLGGALTEYSSYLFSLHYGDTPPDKFKEAAQGYGRLLSGLKPFRHKAKAHLHDKIRVGYLSPDFAPHVMSCFMRALFRDRDKYRFQVYGYAACPPNPISREFAQMADGWREIAGMDAAAVARLIRDDGIDILVDLSGHTAGSCLPILAYRPAPVQICGLGWFAPTGLPTVDYFLTDVHCAPPGEEEFFGETLLRLPHSHMCYTPIKGAPGYIPPAPWRRNGYVTFASFCNFDRLTAEVLSLWREILTRVPTAKLFIKNGAFDQENSRKIALDKLQAAGIPLDRLKTEGHTADYLRSYEGADIVLDTFPYPGGGSTCDALYMGVPVVTMKGNSHHGRFGASLLVNVGLEDLIAASRAEYIEKAVALAEDGARLTDLHQRLRRQMQVSAVMDGAMYMADLEAAYSDIWRKWLREEKALSIILRREEKKYQAAEKSDDWATMACSAAWLVGSEDEKNPEMVFAAALSYYHLKAANPMATWGKRALAAGCAKGSEAAFIEEQSFMERGRFFDAWKCCEGELSRLGRKVTPGKISFLISYASLCGRLGDPKTMQERYFEAYELSTVSDFRTVTERAETYSSWLLCHNYFELDERTLLQRHERYNELFAKVKRYDHTNRPKRDKLRIGYISPDFRNHVMFYFYLPMFTHYAREKFTVYAYSLTDRPDDYTKLLAGLVDEWRDMEGKEAREVAAAIYADGIDILVDLAGHTVNGGLPAMAYKPAPVQISGLGYMATTGLKTVDYFLTDKVVDPPGLHEEFFTEKLLRLPSQFCYANPKELPVSVESPVNYRGWVLFGVFNNYRKVTEEMLACWQSILAQVPNSKILLKCQLFCDPKATDMAYLRLKDMGFDMDRVLFEPATQEYMTRYLDVDIALDTFPYPGGGTTADALYMGVPVITRYSDRRSTRFAYGMLSAIGLGELATQSAADYVAMAVALAKDVTLLNELHRTLRGRMQKSPLMDAENYMRELEGAYERIWQEFLNS